jgi:ribosome biogenesis GTPase / thiamine phosphate phosphatase
MWLAFSILIQLASYKIKPSGIIIMKTSKNSIDQQGIVCKKLKGFVLIDTGGETIRCKFPLLTHPNHLSGERREKKNKGKGAPIQDTNTEMIAVGDRVVCREGQVISILPRCNQLSRRTAVPMPGAHANEQVIAANVDQVVPIFAAANPPPHWNLLDRYLVAAGNAGIPVLVCITKQDLIQFTDPKENEVICIAMEYQKIGYPVIFTSSSNNAGISELRRELSGKVSVFIGKSGVGKTTLLNALEPGLGLRVQQVSQVTGKGIHTTTSLEMFSLSSGGWVVDTPGTREFGLWDLPETDLEQFFPEFQEYLGTCLFRLDCRHIHEPGCAIRKAVTEGKINPRRYNSYLRLIMDKQ